MRTLLATVGFIVMVLFIPQVAFAQVANNEDKPSIVPGEYIVQYKEDQTPEKIRAEATAWSENEKHLIGQAINRLKTIQMRSNGEALPQEMLADLKSIQENLGIIQQKKISENYYLIKSKKNISPALLSATFRQADIVENAEPNRYVYAAVSPNDALYPIQWNLGKINMQTAWEITNFSSQITVAILDSGINYNHEDLNSGKIIKGWDYINNDSDPMDDLGHGTHVAGIVGAITNNQLGVSGISWDVQLLAVKVLNNAGVGDLANVVLAMDSISNAGGANIINLSLHGSGACSEILQSSINLAVSKNITVIVASGNENTDSSNWFPANCQNVISVGASGPDNNRAIYSNYGSFVDVAAPGGSPSVLSGNQYTCNTNGQDCISSTWLSNEYSLSAGTSMATPHVAGLVALMLAKNSSLTPAQIETILKNTGTQIEDTDQPIGKLINAQATLQAVNTDGTTPTPTPTIILLPTKNPTPTRIDNLCPAVCAEGDANCDGTIDNADYNIWKTQFDQYRIGEQMDGTARTADFDCSLENASSPGYVTLADFELWRKHSFVVNPGTACGTIEGESYESLNELLAFYVKGDPLPENNGDFNLEIRGYEPILATKALIDYGSNFDQKAPPLHDLFSDLRTPTISNTYQVYGWQNGAVGDIVTNPEVTIMEVVTSSGELLRVPDSGYEIQTGNLFEVMVLYADEDSITLRYGREDNVKGYTLHIQDICVEPRLVALYSSLQENRLGLLDLSFDEKYVQIYLPALKPLQGFGRAKEGKNMKVAIRVEGSFMDPRSLNSWWR